jgi:hypothetical protein
VIAPVVFLLTKANHHGVRQMHPMWGGLGVRLGGQVVPAVPGAHRPRHAGGSAFQGLGLWEMKSFPVETAIPIVSQDSLGRSMRVVLSKADLAQTCPARSRLPFMSGRPNP